MNLFERWAEDAHLIEAALAAALPSAGTPPVRLHAAMRYATLGGGKRLRGFLALLAARAAGGEAEQALPAACALEMVHAYSLIHDDLPCMDDDDWRRGRPATHRVFGEAFALLAGDALLTQAFAVLGAAAAEVAPAGRVAQAVAELAMAAGSLGMAGGQADDLDGERRDLSLAQLESIHRRKTGALVRGSLRLGGLLGGADEASLEQLTRYGEALGLAFQITDDLLDVEGEQEKTGKTVGKDAARAKATYPRLLGVEGARRKACEAVAEAKVAAGALGEGGLFLTELADFVLARDH
ncbi:MAG: polyprenyl synthetase family protein [Chitinophagales bacterium]